MSSNLLRHRAIYPVEDRIILDIGSLYIKCGFTGESRPRFILPHTIAIPHHDGSCSGVGEMQPLWGLDLASADMHALRCRIIYTLRNMYNMYLLADARVRKVILVESVLMPTVIKEMIVAVLFEVMQTPSINVVPASVVALLTVGQITGLVVDCGNLETTVVPVFEGRAFLHDVHAVALAGSALTLRLKALLMQHAQLIDGDNDDDDTTDTLHSVLERVTLEEWEEMKAQLCFIDDRPAAHEIMETGGEGAQTPRDGVRYTVYASTTPDVTFVVGASRRLRVPGWVRARAAEVLWEGDEDMRSVATVILDALHKCSPDLRPVLAGTTLLTGGTSSTPGFRARLLAELHHLTQTAKHYRWASKLAIAITPSPAFPPATLNWVGAALVGSLKINGQEIVRAEYVKDPNAAVADWVRVGDGGGHRAEGVER
ncbi:actin family [Fimicolochytrium jonesii]|uniref:actin family n=1 Tax=Fimicolochytrium jonesii TaxID=1396493 RepID=UPI0022FEA128|nr:actin family [Fimicolochytrium jonesii]KAI8821843.1 actin family [Fimicolochytrium jonesii]